MGVGIGMGMGMGMRIKNRILDTGYYLNSCFDDEE